MSRNWISPRGRTPTIRFRSPRNTVLVLEVSQLAPLCRTIGAFRVRARAGLNTIHLPRRVDGTKLMPGTYRIRTRKGGFVDERFVVLARRPRGPVAPLLRRNVCDDAFFSQAIPVGDGRGTMDDSVGTDRVLSSVDASDTSSAGPRTLGVQGALGQVGRLLPEPALPPEPPEWARPIVVGGLALAILLLALGAVPQGVIPSPRMAAVVVYRRQSLTVAGLATLAATFFLYLASVL
jgi:hypothetical protein